MLPRDLKAEQFAGYPPEARKVVIAHLDGLRQLPVSLAPSLLRELIEYDYKFPVERTALDKELTQISALTPAQMAEWFHDFASVKLSPGLEGFDWINAPAQFVEKQSAYLWSTHQLDAFRKAAIDYGARVQAGNPAEPLPAPRLGIAVIGQGVTSYDGALFKNLRKHGTYFSKVKPDGGLEALIAAVDRRSKLHPAPYAHWYVDGGRGMARDTSLTQVSYDALDPVRSALLARMQAEIQQPGMGPEELRTHLAQLSPIDLGMDSSGDAVLQRFQLKLLTEGSGTQIYSTTFAQWTTREVLRRAQALTLLVRYAPRQRQRPLNEMLAGSQGGVELDPTGSLVDADMAAYYHWINQLRLTGSDRSVFVVWFEGHSQALAISPSLPHETESSSAVDLAQLLSLAMP